MLLDCADLLVAAIQGGRELLVYAQRLVAFYIIDVVTQALEERMQIVVLHPAEHGGLQPEQKMQREQSAQVIPEQLSCNAGRLTESKGGRSRRTGAGGLRRALSARAFPSTVLGCEISRASRAAHGRWLRTSSKYSCRCWVIDS